MNEHVEQSFVGSSESGVTKYLDFCYLDNIIGKPLLKREIQSIIQLAEKGLLDDAYSKTVNMLMIILAEYIAPKLDKKEYFSFYDAIEYLIIHSEKEIAGALTSINGEFNFVEEINEMALFYLLSLVTYTYDMLLDRYGEMEFMDEGAPRTKKGTKNEL